MFLCICFSHPDKGKPFVGCLFSTNACLSLVCDVDHRGMLSSYHGGTAKNTHVWFVFLVWRCLLLYIPQNHWCQGRGWAVREYMLLRYYIVFSRRETLGFNVRLLFCVLLSRVLFFGELWSCGDNKVSFGFVRTFFFNVFCGGGQLGGGGGG